MTVTNTIAGELSQFKNGLLPSEFKQNFNSNYTFEVSPVNYAQNMFIVLTLPKEIFFGSSNVNCYGLAGTDTENVTCSTDTRKKQITLTDAVTFQRGNPGKIRFMLDSLKNPKDNIETGSFSIETYTPDEWVLDKISTNVTVNFYCEYPCASCNKEVKDQCYSCYSAASEKLFFEYSCYETCPAGYVNTTTNNCTECIEPCATCVETPDTCLTCIEGYTIIAGTTRCRERVYWPFPFILTGVLGFILITISEIVTKRESRFKEAFIAFLSLPEVGAWATLIVFMWWRVGQTGPSLLAAVALLLYVTINFAQIGRAHV